MLPRHSPARVAVEQLGACQRDDQDGIVLGHLDELFDEFELTLVCPVQILKQQYGGVLAGDALEEGA